MIGTYKEILSNFLEKFEQPDLLYESVRVLPAKVGVAKDVGGGV